MALKFSKILTSNENNGFQMPTNYAAFKERKNLSIRKAEYAALKNKFPNKVMVVVERYSKEKNLPILDKTKFLVPEDLAASKLLMIIRTRMNLPATQAIYLMTADRTLINMTKTMSEIANSHKDQDGFLYINYASEKVFG